MLKLLLVASGGALGSVGRYLLAQWAHGVWHQRANLGAYPIGTTFVNLSGSFLFGLIWVWSSSSSNSLAWRLFLLSGMMGALTTFSTLMFETAEAVQQGRWSITLTHLAVHLLVGLGAVSAGLALGRLWLES